MSPSTLLYLSRPPPPPPPPFRLSFFFLRCPRCFHFWSLVRAGKSPSTFLNFSLPPPSLVFLLVSLCCCLPLTTHNLTLFSSFQADLSTAHCRCDESFDCHFSICPSTSASTSWYLIYVRFPLWHVFTTIWPFTDMCFCVQFVVIESRGMLCFSWMQWRTPFSIDEIFHLRPLIVIFSISFLFVQHVRWPDEFVSFFIVLEVNENMCYRLRGSFNSRVSHRHSYFCYRFFQKLYDLWFRCFTVESCYHCLALIPVNMRSLAFLQSCFRIFCLCKGFSILYSWISHLFVGICHLLLSLSRWLSSSRVIVLRLNQRFFVETFPSFRRFFFWFFECVDFLSSRTTRLHFVPSVCLRLLQSTSFFVSIFFWFQCIHWHAHIHSSQQSQRHINRSFCSNVVLLLFFFRSTLFHDARGMSYFAGLQIFSQLHPILTLLYFFVAFCADCLSAARSHVYCHHVLLRTHWSVWRCGGRTLIICWTDVLSDFATHSEKPPGNLSCLGANNREQVNTWNPNPEDEDAWRPHKRHSRRGSDSEFRRIRGMWVLCSNLTQNILLSQDKQTCWTT